MFKKSRLRWFGHVERKDDNDWVKRITWEVEGIRQRGRPKKTGWDFNVASGINGQLSINSHNFAN